jgi:DNA-binding Lrp family transcriptional regulator
MNNKKLPPETSRAAYHSLDPVKISEMHKKIQKALKALGSANYEGIALYLGVPEQRVWKRLKEACDAGLISKTGETVPTKSNRQSYVYAAVGETPIPIKPKREKSLPGKSIVDYSKAIQQLQIF